MYNRRTKCICEEPIPESSGLPLAAILLYIATWRDFSCDHSREANNFLTRMRMFVKMFEFGVSRV